MALLAAGDARTVNATLNKGSLGKSNTKSVWPQLVADTQKRELLGVKRPWPRIIEQPRDSIPRANQEPDCIFWPSPRKAVDAMLELAEVKESDVLFDLGSGDGRICIAAAKKYGARAYGYEIQEKLVKQSLMNVKTNDVEDLVTIERRNIFKLVLSEADVVTLWLLPVLNAKLISQLEKMKPGSRIVSLDFDMCDIAKPDKVIEVEAAQENVADNRKQRKIYLWKTPLKIDRERYQNWLPTLEDIGK
jgi:hypothetical protein